MILPDVNVLVYAHREDAADHAAWKAWLKEAVTGDEPFGLAGPVVSGFLRIVTHPRIYPDPTPMATAVDAIARLRDRPNALSVSAGPRHWEIFARLLNESGATGNLVSDAYLAALAIEYGAELITTDRDFARFDGLRWRHPLKPRA